MIRVPLVVTWHNAVLGSGGSARTARLLQRLVARGADLTLGASSDLVAEATGWAPGGRGWRRSRPRRYPSRPSAARTTGQARAVARRPAGADGEPAGAAEEPGPARGRRRRGARPGRPAVRGGRRGARAAGARAADRRRRFPVRLLGHRDDLPSLLPAADLALLTSTWEARALVAQEALLSGLPLISTRVGGIEELVGDAAVLVEPGDAAGRPRRLVALADDPQERARLAAASLRQAASWPDEDDVVEDLLARTRPSGADR